MNDPPSDVNENAIDIFVLSLSETVGSLFTEHLESKGYQVTLFTDGNYLLETLHKGKPNLLICDTTTLDEEGYEICGRIKADDDLWVIPVLILTSASTLADLLLVLDCNADNFMPYPLDLSYCLSIIDSMLGTPVERQTPDQIKTQFKISHDDRIYVVAANRRKLLEFLLSSFEIAVNKSSELMQIKRELQALSESERHLEEKITEQTLFINRTNATLTEKDQEIIAFTGELEEKEQIIAQKTDEIGQLVKEIEGDKALLTTYEEKLRSIVQEIKEIDESHHAEIDNLGQQISELSRDLETAKTSLEAVQTELDEEKTHATSLECTLELLGSQKELGEKTLRTLTLEHEQLKSALADEKNRLTSAEQEIEVITLAKTQSEQDLTQKITVLNETAQQQDVDLIRLKDELEVEKNQRISAENQLGSLQQDKEQRETSFQSNIRDLNGQLGELQERYESICTALENEKDITKSLKKNLADLVAQKEKTEELARIELDSNKATLSQLKTDLEEAAAIRTSLEKDLETVRTKARTNEEELARAYQTREQTGQQVKSLSGELEQVKATLKKEQDITKFLKENLAELVTEKEKIEELVRTKLDSNKAALSQLKTDLEDAAAIRTSLEKDLETARTKARTNEEELARAYQTREQTGQQVKSLSGELEQVKTALINEQDITKNLKENLAELVTAKEKMEDLIKTDLDSYKTTFIKLKRDLDDATATRISLEREIEIAKTQNKVFANELNLASQSKEQAGLQVRSLADELEKVKAELKTERSLHQAGDENVEKVVLTMEHLEQDLRKSVDERNRLNELLENEQKLRLTAEENLKAAVQEHNLLARKLHAVSDEQERQEQKKAQMVQDLKKDLEILSDQQKSLKNQVNLLTGEKLQAEGKVQALTTELEQARTALANEWENHMTSDELLAAAVEEQQHLQQSLSQPENAGIKKEPLREIMLKKPDLLAVTEPEPHSLTNVPPPEQRQDFVEGEQGTGEVFPEIPVSSSEPDEDMPAISVVDESSSEKINEEPGYADESTDESGGTPPAGIISFNRRQWFDLLKWAHHSKDLSHDQRLQIVRMGRLIQKDRKLTQKQEDQVRALIVLVQTLGYKPS